MGGGLPDNHQHPITSGPDSGEGGGHGEGAQRQLQRKECTAQSLRYMRRATHKSRLQSDSVFVLPMCYLYATYMQTLPKRLAHAARTLRD